MKQILVILMILSLTACATSRGFDRGNLRHYLSEETVAEEKVITDAEIAKALELKPQLPERFKLAIFFVHPESWSYYDRDWKWMGEDKDKLLEISKELVSQNVVSDVFVLNDSIVSRQDLKSIRLAAARAGADAVLVVNGTSDIDRYNNFLGASYIFIVTPLFVPGTVVDALFMTSATMWDVRNEYLYLSIEAEGMANQVSPAAFIEEDEVIKEAKALAISTLKDKVLTRLSRMENNF